jgi:outer membrane lipoprotein carrier protein
MRLVLLLLGSTGLLLAASADEELAAVMARYNRVNSMSGRFNQRICSQELGYCQEMEGKFFLSRPGRFRFEVFEPERQTVVGDTDRTWFFWPDSNLARRTPPVPNPFFEILLNASRLGLAAESLGTEKKLTLLTLVPTDSLSGFQRIRLLYEPKTHEIAEIAMDDGMGTQTHYELSEVKLNPKPGPTTFTFTPPPGAVIEE